MKNHAETSPSTWQKANFRSTAVLKTAASKRDADYEINRIRPNGTGLLRLTHLPGNDAHPSISPDGEWIAFATSVQGFKDEAIQPLLAGTFQPYGEIAVMRIDGSYGLTCPPNLFPHSLPNERHIQPAIASAAITNSLCCASFDELAAMRFEAFSVCIVFQSWPTSKSDR